MALVDAVAEVKSQQNRQQGGDAPTEDGRPEETDRTTSHSNGLMLPPYLHTEILRPSGSLLLIVSLIGVLWFMEAHEVDVSF